MANEKIILDDHENKILELYEDGKLNPSKSQVDYQAIAQTTLKKPENQYKNI